MDTAADHAPAVYAPQGVYGQGVHVLAPGETWLQSYELLYLSGQVGLGKGFDAALGVLPRPYDDGVGVMPALEVGWSREVAPWTFRGSVVAAGELRTFADDRDSEVAPMGLGATISAAWGERQRHAALTVRVLDLPSVPGGGAFTTLDGVWTLAPHWAALAGISHSVIVNEFVTIHAVTAGGGARFVLGRFSADLGLQLGGGGRDTPCAPEETECTDGGFYPLPTLALRYGVGG